MGGKPLATFSKIQDLCHDHSNTHIHNTLLPSNLPIKFFLLRIFCSYRPDLKSTSDLLSQAQHLFGLVWVLVGKVDLTPFKLSSLNGGF